MKKVLAFVLSLCLLLGLTACGGAPIEVKKFASETEMQDYLQGVWGNYDKTQLIFFDGDQVYLDENLNNRIEYSFENSLEDIVKEEGYAALSNLAVKEHMSELEKEWFTDGKYYNHCNPKKGTITYQYDGAECVIYVGDGIIYSDYDCVEIEKISDTPSYTCDELITHFEEALKNYVPEAKDVKLSNKQYAEALMELHPEIKNFPLAIEENGFYLYSDTGKGNNDYNAALMWSDTTLVLTKRSKSADTYKVYLTDSSLMIQDKHHRESWETLIADALALFGGVPGLPTPQELVAEFREKGKTETYVGRVNTTTTFEYETEIGGITFEMDESFSANNNSKLLILRFE